MFLLAQLTISTPQKRASGASSPLVPQLVAQQRQRFLDRWRDAMGLVEGGAYRLRHTFALRQLRRGKSPDLVAKWLGVVEMRVMDRYRRVDYSSERPD